MPRSVVVMFAVLGVGVLLLAGVALTTENRRGFTLGVTNGGVAAELMPGSKACQAPIRVPDEHADFSAVKLSVGTFKRPGPALELTVTRVGATTPIARGRLAGGYPDIDVALSHTIPVGRVTERGPFEVCVRNLGPGRAGVMGNAGTASRTTSASLRGTPIAPDLNLSFERSQPRSVAATVPAMFARASLFRAEWVGAWTYMLAALIVLVAVPVLLARALRSAERD